MDLARIREHYRSLDQEALEADLERGPDGFSSLDVWAIVLAESERRGMTPPPIRPAGMPVTVTTASSIALKPETESQPKLSLLAHPAVRWAGRTGLGLMVYFVCLTVCATWLGTRQDWTGEAAAAFGFVVVMGPFTLVALLLICVGGFFARIVPLCLTALAIGVVQPFLVLWLFDQP